MTFIIKLVIVVLLSLEQDQEVGEIFMNNWQVPMSGKEKRRVCQIIYN